MKTIPDEWKEPLQSYLKSKGSKYNLPSAYDFNHDVEILFADGSYIKFRHSFFIKKEDQIMVFTEHCGYHIFDLSSYDTVQDVGVNHG